MKSPSAATAAFARSTTATAMVPAIITGMERVMAEAMEAAAIIEKSARLI
jgi:hypothetical protein